MLCGVYGAQYTRSGVVVPPGEGGGGAARGRRGRRPHTPTHAVLFTRTDAQWTAHPAVTEHTRSVGCVEGPGAWGKAPLAACTGSGALSSRQPVRAGGTRGRLRPKDRSCALRELHPRAKACRRPHSASVAACCSWTRRPVPVHVLRSGADGATPRPRDARRVSSTHVVSTCVWCCCVCCRVWRRGVRVRHSMGTVSTASHCSRQRGPTPPGTHAVRGRRCLCLVDARTIGFGRRRAPLSTQTHRRPAVGAVRQGKYTRRIAVQRWIACVFGHSSLPQRVHRDRVLPIRQAHGQSLGRTPR